jgi:acetylornithine deacetylase/succinyl-diaminopimelate desuccinylase-like protein
MYSLESRHLMPNDRQHLDRFLNAHLDGYIAETSRLCAQPSVSATNQGTRECAGLVADTLRAHGFNVSTFETPGNPVLVGHADGQSERTLLFYNHYDVQPPEPLELWAKPPFEPVVRDGALYARGAKDDKGELVARLAAVDAVRAANAGHLPCGITFVVEGQEEVGSPHIVEFVRDHPAELNCHAAIWEEGGIDPHGNPVISLGNRGVLYIELTVQVLSRDAHSGSASILPNAAWRLLRALSSLKDEHEHILIPGFYDAAKQPSTLDRERLDALPDDEPYLRQTFGVTQFVRGLTGKALDYAVFEPTCNIAGLTAGYQGEGSKTVIPAKARAKVDFRLVPDQDPLDILAKLRAYLDGQGFKDVEMKRLGAMWPYQAVGDNRFVTLVAHTGQEVYEKPSVIVPLGGGSSPRYAFGAPLGDIPVVGGVGVGYWDNRTHSPNEHVRLVDFQNAARHIARIVVGFAALL